MIQQWRVGDRRCTAKASGWECAGDGGTADAGGSVQKWLGERGRLVLWEDARESKFGA